MSDGFETEYKRMPVLQSWDVGSLKDVIYSQEGVY